LHDQIPPAAITNLAAAAAENSITWTWNNPTDGVFDGAVIFVDGVNVFNSTTESYTISGLTCGGGESHTINIHTVDKNGNVNTTDVIDTAASAACPTIQSVSSSGGGGGGGGAIIRWTCTEWSACSSDNTQSRTCTRNTQGTITSRVIPDESKTCTYVAPAVQKPVQKAPAVVNEPEPAPVNETIAPEPIVTPVPKPTAPTGFAGLTGRIISGLAKPAVWQSILAFLFIGGTGYAGYFYLYKKRK
jgi:hypothetical protein